MEISTEELYEQFLSIKNSSFDLATKSRILTVMLSSKKGSWKVVGITKQALEEFKKNNFKYTKGLNRSHIVQRKSTHDKMMSTDFNSHNEWWRFHIENDKTIISMSLENKNVLHCEIFEVPEELDLFENKIISWNHSSKEVEFLKKLAA